MSQAKYLTRAIERFGVTVHIIRNEKVQSTKAFIQPLRRRHHLYINDRYLPDGCFDSRYLLYIGLPSQMLDTSMCVQCDGVMYKVVTTEKFVTHDEAVYVWAVLLPVNN